MVIRALSKDDIPQLAGLYFQFWEEDSDPEKMKSAFDTITAAGSHILLCAKEGDRLIGSVMGVICAELYGDCRPFLVVENMIVDRNYRRKSIGNALLSELEQQAKARNCTQMILVTETDRSDACSFYENYGFSKNTTGYKKKL